MVSFLHCLVAFGDFIPTCACGKIFHQLLLFFSGASGEGKRKRRADGDGNGEVEGTREEGRRGIKELQTLMGRA